MKKNLFKIPVIILTIAVFLSCASTDSSFGNTVQQTPAAANEIDDYYNPGIFWSFDEGVNGWEIIPSEEFWRYTGPVELSWDNTTFGKGMLRLDVDFTENKNIDWSEPKIRNYFNEPIEMRGLTAFVFDIYYNPMLATSGHFKSKVIAMDGNTSIIDSVSGEINGEEEVGDFLKTTIRLNLAKRVDTGTMDGTIFSIAGYLTDYKGPVFFDNLRWESSASQHEIQAAAQTAQEGSSMPTSRLSYIEDSPNKKRLMNYLADQYGKNIISGQMDASWTTNRIIDMITRVYTDTGKYPAIKGFDFIELGNNNAPYFGGREQVDEAIEWWEGKNNGTALLPDLPDIHGIVTFCWHWRMGSSNAFYTKETTFRIPWKNGKLDTESSDFKAIIADLDKVALRLTALKDRDIPVLWRPLHEASGGWFWWGASEPAAYIALWEFMHDYLTYEKGLNNLIWVWNGENAQWFPNPATVEIVGRDLYSTSYSSQKQQFDRTGAMDPSGRLIVALTENGRIPDPDECIKDGAMWSWFMTWNDRGNSFQGENHNENFWTGESVNTQAHKMKVYHHPSVITLDKLPDLTKYRLN